MTTESRSISRAFVDAMLAHDEAGALALFDPDGSIDITGRHVLAGSYGSVEHYLETRQWIFREHDAGVDMVRCDALLEAGETAVALVEERAHRENIDLRYRAVYVFTLSERSIRHLSVVPKDP